MGMPPKLNDENATFGRHSAEIPLRSQIAQRRHGYLGNRNRRYSRGDGCKRVCALGVQRLKVVAHRKTRRAHRYQNRRYRHGRDPAV